jgi:hypothetical protein
MDHKDSLIQREKDPRRSEQSGDQNSFTGLSSKLRGFRNDPDDPNNPNKVRESYLQKMRPLRLS